SELILLHRSIHSNTIEANFCLVHKINADLEKFHVCLNEEMVADLRYFNSLELEVDSLRSQLETQKTQFLNEIDRLSREYYYADHMNAILGVYTKLDEVTNLQCDYLVLLEKCKCHEKELSKSNIMSKTFETIQKHAINHELELEQCKENMKNDKSFKVNQSKDSCKEREQYFEIQDLKAHLQDKGITIRVIPKTSVSGPQLKSNLQGDRVLRSNSRGKKLEVEEHHRNVKFPKNKTSVTAFNDSLNAKTLCNTPKLARSGILGSGRVIPTTSVSRPQLKSNPYGDRVLRSNSHGKKLEVEEHRRNVKLSKNKTSVTACSDSLNAKTLNVKSVSAMCAKCVMIEIVLFIVDSGCSKHMTGNLKLLINFVEKFLGTVKFGNDQIAPIHGYGDLVQGAVTIKRVLYVEGLNHNLFSVGQFCDADLEVAFRK
nr:integrase, catalytic region, zinc finger, CCHC-type, peptidase aspartic, catalytic [Tanacetum cinerariifolium]